MDKVDLLKKLNTFLSNNKTEKIHLMQQSEEYMSLAEVHLEESTAKYKPEILDDSYDHRLLQEFENHVQTNKMPSFSDTLLKMIDEKNMKDPDVYRRAGIDRRLFSKIRSDDTYQTSKRTIFSLIIAMKLTEDESISLLEAAGFTFTMSHYFDLIILFFVRNGIYDSGLVNSALIEYEIRPLACND